MEPKYPNVNVQLVGQDGNAFSIMGRVSSAMRSAGIASNEINSFMSDAMSGDYNHLLQTVMAWVNVTGKDDEKEWEDNWYEEDDEDSEEDDLYDFDED